MSRKKIAVKQLSLKTLHPGRIRTRDLLFLRWTWWPLCHAARAFPTPFLTAVCKRVADKIETQFPSHRTNVHTVFIMYLCMYICRSIYVNDSVHHVGTYVHIYIHIGIWKCSSCTYIHTYIHIYESVHHAPMYICTSWCMKVFIIYVHWCVWK
jgi:hypothetical protein